MNVRDNTDQFSKRSDKLAQSCVYIISKFIQSHCIFVHLFISHDANVRLGKCLVRDVKVPPDSGLVSNFLTFKTCTH